MERWARDGAQVPREPGNHSNQEDGKQMEPGILQTVEPRRGGSRGSRMGRKWAGGIWLKRLPAVKSWGLGGERIGG